MVSLGGGSVKVGGEKKEILGAFPPPFFLPPSLDERIKKGRWEEEVRRFSVFYFFQSLQFPKGTEQLLINVEQTGRRRMRKGKTASFAGQ